MTNAVANHAIMFLLMLSRNMHHAIYLRSENILNRINFDKYFESTSDLENYNCIILGHGIIAKKIQSICIALGLNAECISRSTDNKLNNINNLLSNKQFIINSLPLNPETKNLIDINFFNKMENNSYFINIGRGETVIENDLIYALKNGIIAGAALDVFNIEPLSESSELWGLNNVIITPHIAGVTNNYWKKQCELFITNLNNFIYHKPMINQSNI
jgi:phosphoglycerate dehydrogenase-like enzyme